MRRGVAVVAGSRIGAVERPPCRKRPISIVPRIDALHRRAAGRTIATVERIGKRVILRLDSGEALVIEPRMTGLVLLADPPTLEHLRLRIRLAGGPKRELLFWDRRGLGTVRLVTADQFEGRYGLTQIGPDALVIETDDLRARLRTSRRAIKVALLDQKAIAGIGNLYASEILHLAGIHPRRRCSALRRAEWEQLHAAIGAVLNLAIRYEGSTLSDGAYRNALNQQGGFQNHHRVYDRAGTTCRRCGKGTIQRIVQAQRSTFFCDCCQR
jgi:formamidopyrimidine-DNA glycosylase